MIGTIIENAKTQMGRVAYLKSKSDYWPEIFFHEEFDNEITVDVRSGMMCVKTLYASTLVRINRNNEWYAIHHVESYSIGCDDKDTLYEFELTRLLIRKVSFTINLFKISPPDKDRFNNETNFMYFDKLQISEEERLKNRYFKR